MNILFQIATIIIKYDEFKLLKYFCNICIIFCRYSVQLQKNFVYNEFTTWFFSKKLYHKIPTRELYSSTLKKTSFFGRGGLQVAEMPIPNSAVIRENIRAVMSLRNIDYDKLTDLINEAWYPVTKSNLKLCIEQRNISMNVLFCIRYSKTCL